MQFKNSSAPRPLYTKGVYFFYQIIMEFLMYAADTLKIVERCYTTCINYEKVY